MHRWSRAQAKQWRSLEPPSKHALPLLHPTTLTHQGVDHCTNYCKLWAVKIVKAPWKVKMLSSVHCIVSPLHMNYIFVVHSTYQGPWCWDALSWGCLGAIVLPIPVRFINIVHGNKLFIHSVMWYAYSWTCKCMQVLSLIRSVMTIFRTIQYD